MKIKKKSFGLETLTTLAIILCIVAFSVTPLAAGTPSGYSPGHEKVNAIFISDRITDVAYRLGVVPVAYCARCCWPMTQKELSTVTRLGCYRCATVDSVIKTADKHKARLILIEDGSVTINKDWNWTDKFLQPLKEHGYDIHVINFSEGVPRAILEIGKALGKEDKAMSLARQYARSLERIRNTIPAIRVDKKILILHGWGRRGVRVEAPGGYSDRFLLKPLGCVNVGGLIKKQDTKVKNGYFPLKSWQAVLKANPDIIVIYGNSCTVQKSLVRALKRHPELAKVTAIRDHAVYTLPFYMNSSVTQYPKILKIWIDAICRE